MSENQSINGFTGNRNQLFDLTLLIIGSDIVATEVRAMLVRSEKLMTSAEVAAFLRMSPEAFLKKRSRLEAETGFPPPLPGTRPLMWSPWGITAWEMRNLPTELRELLTGAQRVMGADNINVETLTARLQDMRKGTANT